MLLVLLAPQLCGWLGREHGGSIPLADMRKISLSGIVQAIPEFIWAMANSTKGIPGGCHDETPASSRVRSGVRFRNPATQCARRGHQARRHRVSGGAKPTDVRGASQGLLREARLVRRSQVHAQFG